MSEEVHPPLFVYEGLDPAAQPKSGIAEATDAVKNAASEATEAVKNAAEYVGDAIDRGRKPGMPLSILSNVAREAPLGSLLIAFLLGVAVARRR